MGLDMFLFKFQRSIDLKAELMMQFVHEHHQLQNVHDPLLRAYLKQFTYEDESLIKNIAYWRKANQIHHYLVTHATTKKEYEGIFIVPKEVLEALKTLCETIISQKEILKQEVNPKFLKTNLPCKDGFFFGSLNYDESYYEDVQATIPILDTILKELFDNEIIYYYAWY
jgi:hypothetical protein